MNSEDVRERIKEFSNIRENAGGEEGALLEVALFVEDVFGVILSDEEICEENLGSSQAVGAFVLGKLAL
jgi:hypothetical protein